VVNERIQCDQEIRERRPDIVTVYKQLMEAKFIDIACPGDSRVKEKKREKIEHYQALTL